jgi:hypothetical protein
MNLKDLAPKKSKRLNKVMESRFGFAIDYDSLTYQKAQRINAVLGENLTSIRQSYGIHTAERNPKYMEMLMVREGLQDWIRNQEILTEGELDTAEVVLAAKDMVDSVQDMIEDASKMLNEQLPPLLDSIRDKIGTAQAEAFSGSVTGALQALLDNLNSARSALDSGSRSLTGEEVAAPMPGAEMAPEPADNGMLPPPAPDLGDEEDMGSDEAGLNRERR